MSSKLRYYADLATYMVAQRTGQIDVPDLPYFEDDDASAFFMASLNKATFYLEYGAGGSTATAARLGKRFISVETDKYFCAAVRQKLGALSSDQCILHADVGPTGLFGVPLFANRAGRRRREMWRAYGDLPWRQIDDRDQPDLVLIDGRFRVATALTCNRHLRGRTEVPILVDDYFDRAHYSVLEEHLTLRGMHGRMAEFSPSPRETEASAAVLAQYGADWR